MYAEIIVKYIHFLCIFGIVGALVSQHLLLNEQMPRKEIGRLFIIDRIYGFSSILLLGAGFTLWFGVGKPATVYSHNWIFLLKLGLFAVIGVLSIFPTVFFSRQRKGTPEEVVLIPKKIKMFIRIELLILFLLPFLATMMAKGIGYFG